MSAAALLEVRGLNYRRAGQKSGFSLSMPNFALRPGDAVALVGASGSGKSTLLDLLALLRPPSSVARFTLAGCDVAALWTQGEVAARTRLRARAIGYVLQTGGLLPFLSVRENVMLSTRLLQQSNDRFVDELLERLGVAHLARRMPAQISIGERQRVAVARALAHRPQLLIADEPTASLDVSNAHGVLSLLLALVESLHCALVLASHDRRLVSGFGIPTVEIRADAAGSTLDWGGLDRA